MKILLAGCGDIGQKIAMQLTDHHQCYGLKRNPVDLDSSITPIAADLGDVKALRTIFNQGFDVVVVTMTPDARNEAAYQRAYVDTASSLARVINQTDCPPKLVVWVSSTGVYGEHKGAWVDEQTPATPTTFSGRALLSAEQAITRSVSDTIIVRFSGIYGPGRLALIAGVQKGVGKPPSPKRWTNRIHSEDCAGFLTYLIRQKIAGASLEALYIGSDNEPVTQHDIRVWLAQKLGVTLVEEAISKNTFSPPNRRFDNKRLRKSGYKLQYTTFREGYIPLL